MAEHEHWQWQEPGGAWKGAGLYHIILTVTDRQPLLGALVTPEGISLLKEMETLLTCLSLIQKNKKPSTLRKY